MFGRSRESRSREAAGRRNWPEAVPRKSAAEKKKCTRIIRSVKASSCDAITGREKREPSLPQHVMVECGPQLAFSRGRERDGDLRPFANLARRKKGSYHRAILRSAPACWVVRSLARGTATQFSQARGREDVPCAGGALMSFFVRRAGFC